MLKADFTRTFVRDRKRCLRRHWPIGQLDEAIEAVVNSDSEPIPARFGDHAMTGALNGCRAVHCGGRTSNWVLLYELFDGQVIFLATGTHDEAYKR
jgi:mRNA interferase YafQ